MNQFSNRIIISSTLLKELEDYQGNEKTICSRKLFENVITGNIPTEATEAMRKGLYFETGSLGSGRYGNKCDDLPRTTKGEKTTEHKRIDFQIANFKNLIKEKNLLVNNLNTQVTIIKKIEDNVFLKGNLDWFPVWYNYEDQNRICIIDLKLSANIDNKWGDYSWGDPFHMDHIQADLYWNLVQDIDFDLNDRMLPGNNLRKIITPEIKELLDNGEHAFLYWVFGYAPVDDNNDLISQFIELEREPMQIRNQELVTRINKALAKLSLYEDEGWQPNPLRDLCKKCTVSKKNNPEFGWCTDFIKIIKI